MYHVHLNTSNMFKIKMIRWLRRLFTLIEIKKRMLFNIMLSDSKYVKKHLKAFVDKHPDYCLQHYVDSSCVDDEFHHFHKINVSPFPNWPHFRITELKDKNAERMCQDLDKMRGQLTDRESICVNCEHNRFEKIIRAEYYDYYLVPGVGYNGEKTTIDDKTIMREYVQRHLNDDPLNDRPNGVFSYNKKRVIQAYFEHGGYQKLCAFAKKTMNLGCIKSILGFFGIR